MVKQAENQRAILAHRRRATEIVREYCQMISKGLGCPVDRKVLIPKAFSIHKKEDR